MTELEQKQLIRIYNTLSLVSTRGEDTLYMADSLRAIKELASTKPEESEVAHLMTVEELHHE